MLSFGPATVQNTTHLLLCGGRGSRLGGADKPLAEWQGKRLVEYIVEATQSPCPRLVSANRNLDVYRNYGDVFADAEVDTPGHGPLVGILGGLWRCTTDWLLVTPGDTPLLEPNWHFQMLELSETRPAIVAHDGERQQHLHLLLNRGLASSLADFLDNGHFEVHRFLLQIDPAIAHFEHAEQFRNFNRADDFHSRDNEIDKPT